jgi:hypothetical protein
MAAEERPTKSAKQSAFPETLFCCCPCLSFMPFQARLNVLNQALDLIAAHVFVCFPRKIIVDAPDDLLRYPAA